MSKGWYGFLIVLLAIGLFYVDYNRASFTPNIRTLFYMIFFFVGSYLFYKLFEKKEN